MKVLELKTKKIIEVNDAYGERMIEHGLAVLPPARESAALKKEKAKKGDA